MPGFPNPFGNAKPLDSRRNIGSLMQTSIQAGFSGGQGPSGGDPYVLVAVASEAQTKHDELRDKLEEERRNWSASDGTPFPGSEPTLPPLVGDTMTALSDWVH